MGTEKPEPQHVRIVGMQIPFLDLVSFLVKLALAAIPAAILLSFFVIMWMAFLASLHR